MQTLNFIFNNAQLRIYGTVEDPVFVINDICEIIGIDNQSTLIMKIKKESRFSTCNLQGLKIPEYRGQKLAVVNERGLYEIMFRSNSKICEQFKDEIYEYLKQQRSQQNILQLEKLQQAEQEKEELTKKIIDQQLKHQQELENRERIYSVISIHKIDDDYDDEIDIDIMKPQIVCMTTNPQQALSNYSAQLNVYYGQTNFYQLVVLADRLTKKEAFYFKNNHLLEINRQKIQHRCQQSIIPLFD